MCSSHSWFSDFVPALAHLSGIFRIGMVFITGPVLTHLDMTADSLPEVSGDCLLSLHLWTVVVLL